MAAEDRAHLLRLQQEQAIYQHNKHRYRSLSTAEKTYSSLPAYVPAVINHPDPARLTPRLSLSRNTSRPTSRRSTPEVTSRASRTGSSRPNTVSSDATATNESQLSVRNIRLAAGSPSTLTSSDVPWSRPSTVWSVMRKKRHEREMRAELMLRNLQRRYQRLQPVGHSLQKRQHELPLRMQKHNITIATQRALVSPARTATYAP